MLAFVLSSFASPWLFSFYSFNTLSLLAFLSFSHLTASIYLLLLLPLITSDVPSSDLSADRLGGTANVTCPVNTFSFPQSPWVEKVNHPGPSWEAGHHAWDMEATSLFLNQSLSFCPFQSLKELWNFPNWVQIVQPDGCLLKHQPKGTSRGAAPWPGASCAWDSFAWLFWSPGSFLCCLSNLELCISKPRHTCDSLNLSFYLLSSKPIFLNSEP